jgi:hypothetical protein
VSNGRLLLVSGAVTVLGPASAIPALGTVALIALALALAGVAISKVIRI